MEIAAFVFVGMLFAPIFGPPIAYHFGIDVDLVELLCDLDLLAAGAVLAFVIGCAITPAASPL